MFSQLITDAVKKTLTGLEGEKMRAQMLKHYKLLHLIDKEGNWTSPELKEIEKQLLPDAMDITEEKVKSFVDKMAEDAEKNPYLANFLKSAKDVHFDALEQKVKSEGMTVLPDVVAYSMVLENITRAMYNDHRILESTINVFQKVRKENKALEKLPFFHRLKFKSIAPIAEGYVKSHREHDIPRKDGLGPLVLQINILEATISDLLQKNINNAKAGWVLTKNKAGGKELNPQTGSGPAIWSEDKKAVCLRTPLPEKWADLYQTWNMAFVSKIKDYPYIIPKLLIPTVANYHQTHEDKEAPIKYIYKRLLALYVYLNHASFDYLEKRKNHENVINWSDKKLTALWGKVNHHSSLEYKADVAKARNMSFPQISNDKSAHKKTLIEKLTSSKSKTTELNLI